jgi:hypothetical protein
MLPPSCHRATPLFCRATALTFSNFDYVNYLVRIVKSVIVRGRARIERLTWGMRGGKAVSSGERSSIRAAFFFCYFSFGQAKEK